MKRRNFLVSAPVALAGGAAAYSTLGASSCAVSPVSILTGLIASASAVIAGLVSAGLVSANVSQWVAAASKFLSDVAAEIASTDPALTKISKSLEFFTTDFAGVQFPTEVGTFITVAILAINAIEAFLKAQQPVAAAAVRFTTPTVFAIASTPSSADKATLMKVVATQKSIQAKL